MSALRPMSAAVALAAVAAGSCPPATTGAVAEPTVRITIVFSRDDDAPRHAARLRCVASRARATGWLRDLGARRACRLARRHRRLLASVPATRRACTQIFGGPERARVTGRIAGRAVDRTFARSDGCRIDEWARVVPLLPRPRGAP